MVGERRDIEPQEYNEEVKAYAEKRREEKAAAFQSLKEHYSWFPPSFWDKYNAGEQVTWHPEFWTLSDSAVFIEIDDDKWQRMDMHIEYRVDEHGQFQIVVVNNYECGDSCEFRAYTVTTGPSAEAAELDIYNAWEDSRQRQYLKYCEWVVSNEEDPLQEFHGVTVGSSRHGVYECKLVKSHPLVHSASNKVVWEGWRQRDVDGWLNPYWAPFYLHHYLMATPKSWFDRTYFIHAEDIDGTSITWDNIIEKLVQKEKITMSSCGEWAVLKVRIDYAVHNPNYYAKLAGAAQRVISEMKA